MAKVGLTARRRCRADTKVGHSEPMVRVRCGRRLPDKSYPGDNRLVVPKRPKRRHGSAPRCRLDLSWGWSRSQGFGCSPIKKSRELGLDRRETGWSPIYCRRRYLTRVVPSKKLLLGGEIPHDNTAYNGEAYVTSAPRGRHTTVQCMANSLEDRNRDTVIPWEVDSIHR